jgi:hypothetical protein
MSAPLMPSPLDYIGRRRFAFYPAIRYADPNSWILGAGSWSEVQVVNAKTGLDLWIPRRYIGAVSESHDALVVGLTQQIDLRNGEVVPRGHKRIIEMPLPNESVLHSRNNGPAQVVGIRLENKTRSAFQTPAFRVGIVLLFVAGLLALIESASR